MVDLNVALFAVLSLALLEVVAYLDRLLWDAIRAVEEWKDIADKLHETVKDNNIFLREMDEKATKLTEILGIKVLVDPSMGPDEMKMVNPHG